MKTSEVLQLGAIAGFIGTIIYAIDTTSKLRRVSDKLDLTVRELAHTDQIDIPERMVNAAIEKAVDREVANQVKGACTQAVNGVRKDIRSSVERAVSDEYEDMKGQVAKEISKQIRDIDISAVKRQVIAEAKDTAAQKFKSDLDDILEKHNEELESVTRIYDSIADRIKAIGE